MKTNQENMPGRRAGIANVLPKKSPLTIITNGATLVGDKSPKYQGLLEAGCAKLVAFEPDETARKALQEKYPAQHLCLPLFIGDGNAALFSETNWGSTESLFDHEVLVQKGRLSCRELMRGKVLRRDSCEHADTQRQHR
jgi:hypothetical protein